MKKTAIALIMLLAFTVSCKKTVESEKKSWDVNLKSANQLAYEYPSFGNTIKEQIKIAEGIMNQSNSISDEKEKIKKMAEANSQLRALFIRNLDDIKTLKQSIRTKAIEARSLKLAYNEMMGANQAISDGERTISDSDMKLRSDVNNRADANALSGLVVSNLKTAEANIDRIIKTVKDREAQEKKKTEQAQVEKAKVEKAKIEAAQPIKCSYCGTLNLADATVCKSCGAPLKK